MWRSTAFVFLLLVIAGCGRYRELPTAPTDENPPDPTATLSRIQSSIFTPTCAAAGCHDSFGAGISGSLLLTAGRAHENLVDRPSTQVPSILRVRPGDPERSYIIHKLEGRSGITGERMPLIGNPLTPAEISLIRDWIRRGALDD